MGGSGPVASGASKGCRGFARLPDNLREETYADALLDAVADGEAEVRFRAYCGLELGYETMREANFEAVEFRGCLFEGTDFTRCSMTDVRFRDCRFIRASFEGAWFSRCDFTSCSAPGLNCSGARFGRVSMSDCDVRYASFAEASFDVFRARRSRFSESSLRAKKLKHCSWEACELLRVDVFGTSLAGMDVSSCEFSGPVLSSSLRELRGLTVSPQQALELAGMLGLRIADGAGN